VTIFEIKSVTEDDRFVERESRGGAIPRHKLIDRMPITALRFERSQAYDHGDLGVLQIGNSELTSDRNSAPSRRTERLSENKPAARDKPAAKDSSLRPASQIRLCFKCSSSSCHRSCLTSLLSNPSTVFQYGVSIFLLDNGKQFHIMARVPQSKTTVSPYKVQVLDRALAALAILAARSSDCSLAELCPALKLHKSTVHRLMMVLEQHRLVVKSPETGRYRLGLRLYELGSRAIDGLDLRGRARPYLDRLQDEFGETVFFCILDEGQVFYVEKVESQRSVRTACTVGSRAPAYCTAVGKAMLAELPEAEVNKIVQRWGLKAITPNTITTASALKAELKAVRSRGYAIDDEEKEEGLRCIGAAVRSHSGKLAAAMSISGPAFRMTKERVPEIGRALMEAAGNLSAELGYQAIAAGPARRAAS
jgi:DNA-binding IclR family transcriptional regulator